VIDARARSRIRDIAEDLRTVRLDRPFTLVPALERVGAPAFVIDARGRIHCTNTSGRALRERVPDIAEQLRRAAASRRATDGFEMLAMRDGDAHGWVILARQGSGEDRVTDCVRLCVTRWGLSSRQAEVLGHVARGYSNATIAMLLGCVERTVEMHVTAIFDRAGIEGRAALVAKVLTS